MQSVIIFLNICASETDFRLNSRATLSSRDCSGVFVVEFEHILHLFLVCLLLPFNS